MQDENAAYPMDVTLLGMVTEVRAVQDENAESPMDVTPSEMVKEVREVQDWNAEFPMVVTDFPSITPGMLTCPPDP